MGLYNQTSPAPVPGLFLVTCGILSITAQCPSRVSCYMGTVPLGLSAQCPEWFVGGSVSPSAVSPVLELLASIMGGSWARILGFYDLRQAGEVA